MTSPTAGTSVTALWSSGSTMTLSLPALNAGDIVLIATSVFSTSASIAVSSMSATGLTFAKRGSFAASNVAGTNFDTVELWWAGTSANISSGTTLTVNLASTPIDGIVAAIQISGVGSISSPFDGHSGLPATATFTGSSGGASTSISTTNGSVLIIDIFGQRGAAAAVTSPTGATTSIFHKQATSITLDTLYSTYSSAQTSLSVGANSVALFGGLIADAVVGTTGASATITQHFTGISQSGVFDEFGRGHIAQAFSGISQTGTLHAPTTVESGTISQAFKGIGVSGVLGFHPHETGSISQAFGGIAQNGALSVSVITEHGTILQAFSGISQAAALTTHPVERATIAQAFNGISMHAVLTESGRAHIAQTFSGIKQAGILATGSVTTGVINQRFAGVAQSGVLSLTAPGASAHIVTRLSVFNQAGHLQQLGTVGSIQYLSGWTIGP